MYGVAPDSMDSPMQSGNMTEESSPEKEQLESKGSRLSENRLFQGLKKIGSSKWRTSKGSSENMENMDSPEASSDVSAHTPNGIDTPNVDDFNSGDSNPDEAPPMQQPEPLLAPLAQMGVALQADLTQDTEGPTNLMPEMDAAATNGFFEKGQVYYVQVKDGILEIVGSVGDKVVLIKAKTCDVASGHIERAKSTLNAKTMWIQDGYVLITTKVGGHVVHIKAKTSEIIDLTKASTAAKVTHISNLVGEYTAPVTSRATSLKTSVVSRSEALKESVTSRSAALYSASRERAIVVAQPFKPYYVKVQNGVVHIVAIVGDKVVVIQTKIADIKTSVQVRTVASVNAGRAAVMHFTSPFVNRAVSLRNAAVSRIDRFTVSIKNGVVRVQGAVNGRVVHMQVKLSEVMDAVRAQTSRAKEAFSDLTAKLVAMVSSAYGRVCDNMKVLYTNTRDGILHIAAVVNGKIVVLRIKVAEVVELLRAMPMQLYTNGRTAIVDGCSSAKVRVLKVVEFTKTKSIEVGTNLRSVARDRRSQVTAVSAAGGAVVMGTGGGACGLVAGGGVGLVLAPFTLGLSIPVGAGAGLIFGAGAGGAAGLAAGGAAGYEVHKHKDEIGNGVNGAVSKAKAYKALAAASTNKLCQKVVGSTGGTATA